MYPSRSVGRTCFLRNAIKLALTANVIGAVAIPGAYAAEDSPTEEVIITGSRIAAPNQTSSSPILTVTMDDIKTGGRVDITDMLNLLPQINSNSLGQDLGNKTSGLTTAGGVSTANLRGLGPNRTLVLVNGRRLGTGSPQTSISSPAPDIDQIPSALLERVDVVTGGASAAYGSDALAGVVNFITRSNFEGFEIDSQYGGNWHDNDNGYAQSLNTEGGYAFPDGRSWDGRRVNVSVVAGANIADGRGNVTAFLGYQDMDPVTSAMRDFGACQLSFNGTLDGLACSGSSNSNFFYPTNADANIEDEVFSVKGTEFIPRGSAVTTPPSVFNSQGFIYMQRQDTRYNGGFLVNLDVNDYVKPYAEFTLMNDRTHQEVAATALFRSSNVLTDDGNYLVNCSNPLLSAQQVSLICTPAEIAADTAEPGSANANLEIGRRNVEGGPRTYDFEHTNYRAVLGTRGDISDAWSYDAYGQYYYTKFSSLNGKDFGFDKIANALQVTRDASGTPVCISGGACVPYNIFQEGGVTQKALDYLQTLGTATGDTSLNTLHAELTGQLDEYGIRLPTATEGVAINVGYEYRQEKVTYKPDAAMESGLIVGTGGASPAIDNSLSVKDYFAEVRVPIVEEAPGIYDLVANAGYRRSDYSLSGGVDTYKFDMQYAPVEQYRLRASYNRAIRAPAIVELYSPQLVGKIAFGEDPCAPSEAGGELAATFEQCARTGVTRAQYDNKSIPQGTAGQLTQLIGGNPALRAESADTYTVGLSMQPEFLPDFNASIDYYRIKMEDLVGALPATLILSNCLASGDPTFCSQLVRNPVTGTLNGPSVAAGGYIVQTSINVGAGLLSGIDLQSTYRYAIGSLGELRFMLNAAYMLKNETTPVPGGGSYDCAGLFGPTCQTVNPEWQHRLRTAWYWQDGLNIALTWRYYKGVDLDNNDSNPLLAGVTLGETAIFRATMPSMSYFDLAGTWDITDHLQVRGGINNLLDKDPPLAPAELISGGAPNYYEFYDGLGRQLFAAFTARF